jgi:DNA mismatch endonuclease (patch repair protein)
MADNLTTQQRSYTMSRIRSRDTKPELVIRKLSHSRGLRFRIHVRSLRGCPDLVFGNAKVAVFVAGDFWHGWRFQQWGDKLAPYWKAKIEGNRRRDRLTFQWLRRNGWRVIRIWEHQVRSDPIRCVDRIEQCVQLAKVEI